MKEVGLCVQVPVVAVNVWPTWAVPVMVGTTVSTGIAMSSETLKPLVWFGVFVAPVRVSTRLNVTMAGVPDGVGPTWRLVPVICSAPAVLRELKAMADPEPAPRMVPTTVPWGAPTWNAAALKSAIL